MSNKSVVMRECDRANAARKVCDGNVDGETFFQKITGDLLMSGNYACDQDLIMKMVRSYTQQSDLPVVVLTSHSDLLEKLEEIPGMKVFDEKHKDYHPMYGMNMQQICGLIRMAGEEWGCTSLMDKVLLYAMSLMEIVSTHYKVSLPAMSQLLTSKDDFIAELALQEGLSSVVADNIRGNQEAGLLFRRMVEHLEKTFENVAELSTETGQSIQMAGQPEVPHLAFYQYSQNQNLMNAYLKEELYSALQQTKKLRIIADEILVKDEKDDLLRFLVEMKRIGKIELILCSENARNVLGEEEMNFTNTCIFRHESVAAMEKVSEVLFGKYLFHYPVQTVGKPPNLFFTLKKDEHWTIATEERLRVREVDLYGQTGLFGTECEKMAVKIGQKNMVFLVGVQEFFCGTRQGLLVVK